MAKGERGPSRGWGALVGGLAAVVIGFTIIVYEVITVSAVTIPLNYYTYAGAAVLAVGIGLAAIGAEQGAPR